MAEIGFSVKTDKSAKSQVRVCSAVLRCLSSSRTSAPDSGSPLAPSAPRQALDCIKQLQASSTLPIQRARMRIRITMPTKDGKRLKEQIVGAADTVEEDDFTSDEWEAVRLVPPLRAPRPSPSSARRTLTPASASPRTNALQILLIDPGQFRVLTDLLQKETKGKGRIETLNFAAVQGEGSLD